MKLHAGDTVLIITGKDKGKTGTVMRVLPEDGRVVVMGVNMRTRHVKKTFQQAGRILRYEASIAGSNVMVLDPKTGKPARIGYKVDEKGRKIRVSKVSGEEITAVKPKKEKVVKKTSDAAPVKKDAKEAKDAKDLTAAAAPAKKQPFWKRMGFGAAMEDQADVKESPRMQQDQSIPDQQIHVRSGGRGS